MNVLLVGAGGFLGSMARYLTVISVDKRLNSVMPLGTLTVNIAGSFILGFVLALAMKKTGTHLHEWRLFIGTGFCGGFTTFSAFAAENLSLFEQKFPGAAFLYITLSVAAGLLAVWLGFALAKSIL
jgi:CrcB protein